jgi:hypothetical protein
MAAVATGLLMLLLASGAGAGTPRGEPVPVAFGAKAAQVCRDLKSSLDRDHSVWPSPVRQAANLIPGHATSSQVGLFGDYIAAHQLPAYRRAAARFKALRQPSAGKRAWTQFLAGFRDWIAADAAMIDQLQMVNDSVFYGEKGIRARRERAFGRVKVSATEASTTGCLSVIG